MGCTETDPPTSEYAPVYCPDASSPSPLHTPVSRLHITIPALAARASTCGLANCPALEKMYGIEFRASTDDTGNDINGSDWMMETDNDYDVAEDYLGSGKLAAYTKTMDCALLAAFTKSVFSPFVKTLGENKNKTKLVCLCVCARARW